MEAIRPFFGVHWNFISPDFKAIITKKHFLVHFQLHFKRMFLNKLYSLIELNNNKKAFLMSSRQFEQRTEKPKHFI